MTRLRVVDSHTCGQPTRVILDGLPDIGERSAAEAREWLRAEHDEIRRLAVFEPRGSPALLAVALFAPVSSGDPWRAVFIDAAGYPDMCGHATIGLATTLVEEGLLEATSGSIPIEAPGGPVSVQLHVEDGGVASVTLVNRPSYYLETVTLDGPGGEMRVPLAYGGQWYAFVEAAAFGLAVEPRHVPELVTLARSLRGKLPGVVTRADPRTGRPPVVENVMWVDDPPPSLGVDGRNMPVNRAGDFDRSPCGTGTSARLAVLHAAGKLGIGDQYLNSGVLGTVYRARIALTAKVAGISAVVPEITGSAWVTGRAELWDDPSDPLAAGFVL